MGGGGGGVGGRSMIETLLNSRIDTSGFESEDGLLVVTPPRQSLTQLQKLAHSACAAGR